jgi:hypothetical protein
MAPDTERSGTSVTKSSGDMGSNQAFEMAENGLTLGAADACRRR